YASLVPKLSSYDRIRMERHLDEIRALEKRVQEITTEIPDSGGGSACAAVPDPGQDPPIGANNAGLGAGEIGTNTGYSNEDKRAQLFNDLIHMAFVCDMSRVASHMITYFQSHMNMYPLCGIRADLHEIGHRGDPQFTSTEA